MGTNLREHPVCYSSDVWENRNCLHQNLRAPLSTNLNFTRTQGVFFFLGIFNVFVSHENTFFAVFFPILSSVSLTPTPFHPCFLCHSTCQAPHLPSCGGSRLPIASCLQILQNNSPVMKAWLGNPHFRIKLGLKKKKRIGASP